METRTFRIVELEDGVEIHENNVPLTKDGSICKWSSHKIAVQYLRRWAKHNGLNLVTVSSSEHYISLPEPPKEITYGHHLWRKANLLQLADRDGVYDKLYCERCGKIAKRYHNFRHFRGEFDPCPSNPQG